MVWPLPVGELEDAFFRQSIGTRIERIEGLAHFVDHVSPPLRTLTVWAVHISVTHSDVEGAQGFLAVEIEEVIIALKGAGELGVVTRFTILEGEDFETGGDGVVHLVAVHPAEAFIFLNTVSSDVFCTDIRRASPLVVVHADVDLLACRAFDFQIRGDLRVVGQLGLDH